MIDRTRAEELRVAQQDTGLVPTLFENLFRCIRQRSKVGDVLVQSMSVAKES